ncbi:hypothetical protein [Paraburkholderia caballeronis]|uniref:hypothetical protein n=1 Tax=Paraburkholderia caballeronis TaxID=416943 RepID=UPI0010670192|nr:hypothetical protein [Paraburkholderia caballeronis]TDV20976.1 hypothetical protein C7408_101495 [Paraburkholderia caballeronis]TDV21405.1 hypothetical protein C7406_102305 [Paraburkholderia caballeronis]TDV33444.1 hypothetical protein C7404_101591 [Paraburkholderia caballeronis]
MNKPSERIVVFVTPAQKRAIAATADGLGISVSELMRRAVIAFSATSDQVKAASIVDRLNAPREPDALAQVLRKAARPLRHGRGSALRGTLAAQEATEAAQSHDERAEARDHTDESAPLVQQAGHAPAIDETQHANPLTAASPLTAEPDVERAAREIAQAVARLSAEADDAGLSCTNETRLEDDPPRSLSSSPFAKAMRPAIAHDDADEHRGGPAPEDGHFA